MRATPLLVTILLTLPLAASALAGPGDAPGSCPPFSNPQLVIPSWDGTPLAADIHVPSGDGPFPLIVRGHGYPGQRERLAPGSTLDLLVKSGYMVLVWDERGLGQSGGEVHLLDPAYEGRDVLALIEHVDTTAPWSGLLARDAGGNPIVGMSGGSYGGGIQWSALVADRLLGLPGEAPPGYLDALAPEITWNSLEQSLIPNGVPKLFITTLLLTTGETSSRIGGVPPPQDGFCPNVGGQQGLVETYVDAVGANGATPAASAFLGARSIASYVDALGGDIPPTFLVQGLRDTLFPTNEAVATFEAIRGVTTAKLMLHPTGHGWSGVPPEVNRDLRAWFNHTLRGDALPSNLAGSDFVYAKRGALAPAWGTDFVYASWDDLAATAATTKTLAPKPWNPIASLPAPTSYADVTFFQGQVDDQKEPGRAPMVDPPGTAVSWEFDTVTGIEMVGTPRVTLSFTTTSSDLFLFGKLYHVFANDQGPVIYHQVMPVRVTGANDGAVHTVSWDLATLSATLGVGHKVRLVVSTSDAMHAASREPGVTVVTGGALDLPVVSGTLLG